MHYTYGDACVCDCNCDVFMRVFMCVPVVALNAHFIIAYILCVYINVRTYDIYIYKYQFLYKISSF